jgi:hypothetical protein
VESCQEKIWAVATTPSSLDPTRLEISPEIRRHVITLLKQILVWTVDLRSHVKQAGRNVKGQEFAPAESLAPGLVQDR